MGIFTNKMRKYILGETTNGYSEETRRAYDRRVFEYAVDGLKDLVLLSERLPESQQQEIFDEKTLRPLLRNLFTLKTKSEMTDEEIKLRRERILKLSYDLLMCLGEGTNASGLAKEQMRILTVSGLHETLPCIVGLKAILIKSMGYE